MPAGSGSDYKRRRIEQPTVDRPKIKAKCLTIRIDDIPNEQTDGLEINLKAMIEQDAVLQEAVLRSSIRSMVPLDLRVACATVSFHTSLCPSDLVYQLSEAGDKFPYSYSHSFEGFTPVYQSPTGATVDIIAIAGLNSHPLGTWKAPGSDQVWLRDFLPKDQPDIRVLLYGYDTTLRGSVSKQSIEELGHSLLEDLVAFRGGDETAHRPVIFIGHSLGGLLIKELLIRAIHKKSDDESDLATSCYGMLFFGVPNHGLRNETLNAVVRGQPNEALVQSLQVGNHGEPSHFLARLSSDFAQSCKGHYQVISFYELELSPTIEIDKEGSPRKTGQRSLLVTRESATSTGIVAAADEDNIALPTNHSGLVKFHSRSRGCYPIINGRLSKLIAQATMVIPKRFEEQRKFKKAHSLHHVRQNCLKSLAFPDMEGRYHYIQKATEHTCEWLLSHDIFRKWAGMHHSLLWIAGHPGSGKSTLMKHTRQMGNGVYERKTLILSFFFHARGNDLQKSLLGLFRSLLHQILHQIPNALTELVDYFDLQNAAMGEVGKDWEWHVEQLQDFFRSAIPKLLRNRPLVLLIDALDEAGETAAVYLTDYLSKQVAMASPSVSPFRVCFSCRYYPIILPEDGLSIHLKNENEHDITAFVKGRLPSRLIDSTTRQLVASRANGSFMWARLASDRALQLYRRGESPRKIQANIEQLPAELDEIYRDLIQTAEDRPQTLKLMQWLCFSMQALTLNEIQWAMVIDPDAKQSLHECKDSDAFMAFADIERRIKFLSCGLAEFATPKGRFRSRRVVQFIHQSAKDFIISDGLFLLDDNVEIPSMVIPVAHCQLAHRCVRYLNMVLINEIGWPISYQEVLKYPLCGYAVTWFVSHLQHGEAAEIYSRKFFELFGWPDNTTLNMCASVFWNSVLDGTEIQTGLLFEGGLVHLAAMFGLTRLLHCLLLEFKEAKIDLKAENCTPLLLAARNGHGAIVKLLLDTGRCDVDSRDARNRNVLLHASLSGNEAVVKLLLERSQVDVCLQDQSGYTSFFYAGNSGHAAVADLLLKASNSDGKPRDAMGRALLAIAAGNNWYNTVKVLCGDDKVDIESRDLQGRTALSWAAENGHTEAIQILLTTRRVDVNSADIEGRTPLSWAAGNGHRKVALLLLTTGRVNVDLADRAGRTPLSRACGWRHSERRNIWTEDEFLATIKLLLEIGQAKASKVPAKDLAFWEALNPGLFHGMAMKSLQRDTPRKSNR